MLLPMLMQAGNILDTSKSFGGRTRSVLPVVEADFNKGVLSCGNHKLFYCQL